MVNYSKLYGLVPEPVMNELRDVCTKYQINSPIRLAHFLAQCDHESGGFKTVEENLNYSLEALLRVFGKYFDAHNVEPYVRNKIAIANRVYANRMGNGPEASGDGWTYRGRGYIQLTGKDNYQAFDKTVPENILSEPSLVATRYPLQSAGWFWNENGLNAVADKGADQQVVSDITKKVNGGYHGLENRLKLFNKYHGALNV